MIRLVFALTVAGLLLPAQTLEHKNIEIAQTSPVSSYETMSAMYSLYSDVINFCDRNESACTTGKTIAQNTLASARSFLGGLADAEHQEGAVDLVETGSIQK